MCDVTTAACAIEHPKVRKTPYYVGMLVVVVSILTLASVAVTLWARAQRWDPLGDYPLQIASSPNIPGRVDAPDLAGIPTIYRDEKITVTGIKCGAEPQAVHVIDVLRWVSDAPPGELIETGRGSGDRGPGCISATYRNPIPKAVQDAITDMAADGITQSTWHMTGTETPIRSNGETGVDRTWVSTSFVILHTDRPS